MVVQPKQPLAAIRIMAGLTQKNLVDLVNNAYGTADKPTVLSLNTVKSAEHKRGNISRVTAQRIINVINLKLIWLKILKKGLAVSDIDWNIGNMPGRPTKKE